MWAGTGLDGDSLWEKCKAPVGAGGRSHQPNPAGSSALCPATNAVSLRAGALKAALNP